MTEYDVAKGVEDAVEATDLPSRLREELYRVVDDRDMTVAETEELVQAVESRYIDTRVDPLDPVGTVSAQSIGEPGTQMSVPHDERILVRRDGETSVVETGPLVDDVIANRESNAAGDHEVALAPDDLEVLSLCGDEQVAWKPVEELSRHETPDELLEFTLESGRSIRATKAHSFVTRRDNEIVPVAGEDLEEGDWLPVVDDFDVPVGSSEVSLRQYLAADDYWFTSTLADGGVTELPGGDDQVRNRQAALDAGDLEEEHVYPVQGTVGLPEQFPLDEETGFFVGAWLAEGSLTDYYVSVSNVDATFQDHIRGFAERFDLSVNEYDNESGFATGHDVRVNGKVLADVVREACTEDGEKVVPGFAFGATDEFVGGLLAGYFSGDGNVADNAVRSSSTSERLSEGIALLLARVGVYATRSEQDDSHVLRIPKKYVPTFHERVGMVGERGEQLAELAGRVDPDGPDAVDQIPNFGEALTTAAREAGIPSRQVNSAAKRQRIGRSRLARLVETFEDELEGDSESVAALEQAVDGDVVWERIESIEAVTSDYEYVYDVSVAGLETFTTAQGVVTHNTMNTFHYAGVAEIDVTQGLPRLIELVDARKEPDTPMMTVYLEDEYAEDREKAHEVVWQLEATRILQLGDISTNVAEMRVQVDLNEETLEERMLTAEEVEEAIQAELGVETVRQDSAIQFGPEEPSYRDLLQLVEELREVVFKGIEDIERVVIRKEDTPGEDEFVLYTEGSEFGDALAIEGVDASRTTTNNIHEIYRNLGVEAARESIINETMDTLEEQGLDDVNVRHLMLVADIMTNRGEIESIGRHGISGSKESVLARAAFEVTVNHLLDAAVHGESDDLDGVTENVIVGKPIKLGTGDVDLRMGSLDSDEAAD
jgi:DNA-directed RNA polymerase subunit A"